MTSKFICLMTLSIFTWPLMAQTFTIVTNAGPIVTRSTGTVGCAWGDVNGDNLPDLFVCEYNTNALYLNNGDGSFQAVAGGHHVTTQMSQNSAIWGDFDNDGHNDLYLSNLGPGTPIPQGAPLNPRPNFLYRNAGPPTYELVLVEGGAINGDMNMTWTSSWVDLDNDGDLDLFVAGDQGDRDLLFRNDGGTFTQITDAPMLDPGEFSAAATWEDMDGDGDQDLLVTNFMSRPNELYRNLLTETGEPGMEKIVGSPLTTQSNLELTPSWGDYDNDGDLDVFMGVWNNRNNVLYRNDGAMTFTRITDQPMVSDQGWPLGNAWLDYDNDGDLDLFVSDQQGRDRMYRNDGGRFIRLAAGDLGDLLSPLLTSGATAVADYDNDGDVDIYLTTNGANRLYRNDGGNTNNWLNIRCTGTVSNRAGIDAVIRVRATIGGQDVWQMRSIHGGPTGDRAQSMQRAHFGLGDAAEAAEVVITWPSGIVQNLGTVTANQHMVVTEAAQPEVAARLIYPWISNREGQFESVLVTNNLGDEPVTVTLTARRAEGAPETVQRTIPAHGFMSEAASVLFPTLGSGAGYAVELASPSVQIAGRWVTNNLAAASGHSPSQGVASPIPDDDDNGQPLVFGYLPVTGASVAASVLVNLGEAPTDVTLTYYRPDGTVAAQQTLTDLPPLRPVTATANTEVPEAGGDLYMVATPTDAPIAGVAFIFDSTFLEPAIGNATAAP